MSEGDGTGSLMCLVGHWQVRRVVYWVWLCLAMPCKLAESWVWGPLTQYLRTAVVMDAYSCVAGLFTGLCMAMLVFVPLATLTQNHGHSICTVYLCHLAWALGQVLMNICVYSDVVRRQNIRALAPCLIDDNSRCRLITLGDGGYLGVITGLAVAFPYVAFVYPLISPNYNGTNGVSIRDAEWCRATPEVSPLAKNTLLGKY